MLDEAKDTINYSLAEMDITDDEKERLKAQWTELFNFSAELLPPEEAKKITDAIWNALSKGLEKTDAEFDSIINKMNTDINLAANSWIRGKSDRGIISRILFGAGDSPTKVYEQAQKQAQDVYSILYQRYNKEIEMATEKAEIMKALYGEESAEYKKYADEITRLQALLAQAQINYEAEQVENAEDYAEKIKNVASSTLDAISGLASAMGSYYAEQAEWAKETYGENSEEYQKYLKKEGNMKIAQVWSDWAMGVMAAWAANAKYGVASYILAALQTAALTATAIASTAQIKRQTKASNNGGGSANVGQLTDRVIMADAQRADQTAELNAKYNQGATRVYVTQGDIQDANNDNRVAVTQNRF
jgi:phosphohistidine phosphatase SixA